MQERQAFTQDLDTDVENVEESQAERVVFQIVLTSGGHRKFSEKSPMNGDMHAQK